MLPMDGFVVRCVFGRAGCELAPLLTSPAGGGGTQAPSPRVGRVGVLMRGHRFGTESLRQGRFSPRGRERADAPFCPHPLCPPLPRGGRGGICRGDGPVAPAVRPYTPLPRSGRGAGGEGEKACVPYTPLPRSGRGAGGEGEKACVPCTRRNKRCPLIRGWGGGKQVLNR